MFTALKYCCFASKAFPTGRCQVSLVITLWKVVSFPTPEVAVLAAFRVVLNGESIAIC